jgi:hypothetical protein
MLQPGCKLPAGAESRGNPYHGKRKRWLPAVAEICRGNLRIEKKSNLNSFQGRMGQFEELRQIDLCMNLNVPDGWGRP